MEQINIRRITQSDDSAIAEIIRDNLRKYHLDIPGTAYFDTQLDNLSRYYSDTTDKKVYFIAASEDGEVVGGIGMESFQGFENCGEIQKLYVSEKMQRNGIGQRLLETIENYAKNNGVRQLYLETHSVLKGAVLLYERNGYRRIEKPKDVVHNTMDLFYVKELD